MNDNDANIASKAQIYKTQQVMTASPQELTLMLYNGAIRFVKESIRGIEEKDLTKAHEANMRSQDIVRELMNSLDMKHEVSQGWLQLYDYVDYCLVQGNMKKDTAQLGEAQSTLTELRDTWFQVMKLAREQQGMVKIG